MGREFTTPKDILCTFYCLILYWAILCSFFLIHCMIIAIYFYMLCNICVFLILDYSDYMWFLNFFFSSPSFCNLKNYRTISSQSIKGCFFSLSLIFTCFFVFVSVTSTNPLSYSSSQQISTNNCLVFFSLVCQLYILSLSSIFPSIRLAQDIVS